MNVNLLYSYKDWTHIKQYYDWRGIVKDLGLDALFKAASIDSVVKVNRKVYREVEDEFFDQSVRRVMCVPLENAEEVHFRQSVLKDCIRHEELTAELYSIAERVLADCEKLGKNKSHTGVVDSKSDLITDIRVLRLLTDAMKEVRSLLLTRAGDLSSQGFIDLFERVDAGYSEELQENLDKVMDSMLFYANAYSGTSERGMYEMNRPLIEFDCGIADGLKLGDIRLEKMENKVVSYSNPYGLAAQIKGQINRIMPKYIALYRNSALQSDAAEMEFQAVSCVMSYFRDILQSFSYFFDQLRFQLGFYIGAMNIRYQMKRYQIENCFPEVGKQDSFKYTDLKEAAMVFKTGKQAVGNDGSLDGRMLAVITGANQGGKSTFLRSVGIAQVMMQCGMMVAAKQYRSGLYPNFFTHFTRREDSAMNSGRLDEELKRMDRIIDHLGKDSLILLNESFATTTEKEGSAIAYDIIKALKEEGVRIFTVTHLLSFAQRMYDETGPDDKETGFLGAERLTDGKRTFKMIPHAPEKSSFGLELFEEVLS